MNIVYANKRSTHLERKYSEFKSLITRRRILEMHSEKLFNKGTYTLASEIDGLKTQFGFIDKYFTISDNEKWQTSVFKIAGDDSLLCS